MPHQEPPASLRRALDTLTPTDAVAILEWLQVTPRPITWISAIITVKAAKA